MTVCSGPECGDQRNSRALYDRLIGLLEAHDLVARVTVDWQACFGRCFHGPNLYVRPDRPRPDRSFFADALALPGPGAALYVGLTPDDVDRIVAEHIVGGRVVAALRYRGQ